MRITVKQIAELFEADAFIAVSIAGEIKFSGRAESLAKNRSIADCYVSKVCAPATPDSAIIIYCKK